MENSISFDGQDVKKAAETICYNHSFRKHVDTILLKVSGMIAKNMLKPVDLLVLAFGPLM